MPGRDAPSPREIVAAGYDRLVSEYAAWSSRVVDPAREEMLDELLRRLPERARILDVGCGSGAAWTDGRAGRFLITGIDVSAGQVEAARRNVPGATFIVADVTAIELDTRSFDAALALYSIGHLPIDAHAAVFARFARCLRPGGLLLASVPADPDPGGTERWLAGVPMFFASLGAAGYDRLLQDQGWQVIETRTSVAHEPEGPVRFRWILAATPGEDAHGADGSTTPETA
jgi:SAM-dependent methyltransferase